MPVLLLDSDLPDNDPFDRTLTDYLYGGDLHYRLCQEAVLGIGGVRMLRAFGYGDVASFHLNESHAALLALELLRENLHSRLNRDEAIAAVKHRCVFTTHTPVPAGHDQFPEDLALKVLGLERIETLRTLACYEGTLNMTHVALNLSRYVNGVTERHGEVSRSMFPGIPSARSATACIRRPGPRLPSNVSTTVTSRSGVAISSPCVTPKALTAPRSSRLTTRASANSSTR